MSGSDPSVRKPTGGSGGGKDRCAFRFETVLASPDPDLVSSLSVGELLEIAKIDTPTRGVVAQLFHGDRVGSITRDIAGLRQCIDEGNVYEAEVRRIEGGAVTVLVSRA